MKSLDIKYCFHFGDNRIESFALQLSLRSLEQLHASPVELPEWTRLDYQKCPHCPLDSREHPHCPAAASLTDLVKAFAHVVSHEPINLEVITADRKIYERTTAQRGIGSLLGLLLSTSGCPHTAYFKPMARFHLPLASPEETVFRATAMYLLAQYFLRNDGRKVDYDLLGLTKIYQNLHKLNISLARRLRAATSKDSSINAVIVLDVFTHTLPTVINEQLESIRPLFASYLAADVGGDHEAIDKPGEEYP